MVVLLFEFYYRKCVSIMLISVELEGGGDVFSRHETLLSDIDRSNTFTLRSHCTVNVLCMVLSGR